MHKNNAAKNGGGAATAPKTEPAKPIQAQTEVQPTNESQELRAEIQRLKQIIASGPASIEEKISYFQRKQELIKRLQSLTDSGNGILEHIEKINTDAQEDVFETEHYKLALTAKSGYSGEREVLQFRNPVILSELLTYVHAKIEAKRKAIEEEINK